MWSKPPPTWLKSRPFWLKNSVWLENGTAPSATWLKELCELNAGGIEEDNEPAESFRLVENEVMLERGR